MGRTKLIPQRSSAVKNPLPHIRAHTKYTKFKDLRSKALGDEVSPKASQLVKTLRMSISGNAECPFLAFCTIWQVYLQCETPFHPFGTPVAVVWTQNN